MRIDKEKFNKLKQLDRIEFRQKLNRIEDMGFSLGSIMLCLGVIVCVFLSALIISQEITGEVNMNIFNLLAKFLFFLFLVVIIEFFLIFVFTLVRIKLRKELFEEYFKIEVKK